MTISCTDSTSIQRTGSLQNMQYYLKGSKQVHCALPQGFSRLTLEQIAQKLTQKAYQTDSSRAHLFFIRFT